MNNEKYAEFLRKLTLHSIELFKSDFYRDLEFSPPASLEITFKNRVSVNKDNPNFVINFIFELISESKKKKNFKFVMKAEYMAYY